MCKISMFKNFIEQKKSNGWFLAVQVEKKTSRLLALYCFKTVTLLITISLILLNIVISISVVWYSYQNITKVSFKYYL